MKLLELTPRLKAIADWIPQGAAFADIGTDHAWLPIWLIQNNRVRRCIASDINSKPLRQARENARKCLFNQFDNAEAYSENQKKRRLIQFRLCDGLSGFRPGEADIIAIAGMGGENIADILKRAPWTCDKKYKLLLQPMTRPEALRRFLSDYNYQITREKLVPDRGILYPVIEVTAGREILSAGQCYGGVKLLHDPLENQYLIEIIIRLQNAVAGLNHAARDKNNLDKNLEKLAYLRDILTELYAMREEWRHANADFDSNANANAR